MQAKPITVLMVEDDDVDIEAARIAFDEAQIANPVRIATDGIVALDILRGGNGQERLEKPYVIFLDLNLPRMDGIEFLEELRKDANLRDSVVFVLTTSKAEQDRAKAYDKNVAGYILKNSIHDGFESAATLLNAYWQAVALPGERL